MSTPNVEQSILNKAHKDKFLMILTVPDALRDIDSNLDRRDEKVISDSIQYSVYGTLVPKLTVDPIVTSYAGQAVKHSSHSRPAYENIFVNFTVDNQYNNYWMLFKWINVLNNNVEAIYDAENIKPNRFEFNNLVDPNLLEEYSTTITVFGLDEYDKRRIQFDYTGAFPVSLGSINFNYRDPGELETAFEFGFTQFKAKLLS